MTKAKGVTIIGTLHDVRSARLVARPWIRTFLVMGIVVTWVSTNKALKALHSDEWDKPFFLGIALKSTWSLCLLLWPILRYIHARREVWNQEVTKHAQQALGETIQIRAFDDPDSGSLTLDARTIRCCLLFMMLVQVHAFRPLPAAMRGTNGFPHAITLLPLPTSPTSPIYPQTREHP